MIDTNKNSGGGQAFVWALNALLPVTLNVITK